MARKHWKEGASPIVRGLIERALAEPYRCADEQLSWCEAWSRGAEIAISCGLDMDPPPTTATDRIAKLRAEKDFQTLNQLYRLENLNFEADREARALARWTGLRRWAQAGGS